MACSYRNAGIVPSMQNSSDDGELNSSDSDSDKELWSKKRPKPSIVTIAKMPDVISTIAPVKNTLKAKRSKNANIWGSVLTEQSSHDISSSLGAVGMQHQISRGPESFDLPFPSKRGEKYPESSDSSNEETENSVVTVEQPQKNTVQNRNGKQRKRKRKVPKNKKNVPEFKPGQCVNLNKRCELSDTDPVDKVAEEIAFRLWERKRDLIRSLTEILGVPTTIDFYNKTEDLEKKGGLLTFKGVRRRTPGGTFLYLIRNDSKIDQEPINKIFSLESERERTQWEQRKIAKRKSKDYNNGGQQTNVMDCNEVIQNCSTPDMSMITGSDSVAKTIQQTQECKIESVFQSSNHEQKNSSELSDGEIMDSEGDDDVPNAESFG